VAQLTFLVSDEKSAIQWLRQQLDSALGGEPQTFADLQPKFMRGSNPAKHEQMPELGIILEQNFLEDENGKWRAPDPNKAADLERLRLKSLLREFNEYVQSTGRQKQSALGLPKPIRHANTKSCSMSPPACPNPSCTKTPTC